MLSPTLDTIRLFVHVLAASVWVGGQIALAGIVPALRASHPDSTKTVAKAFGRVAWSSFVVLTVTGIWNLVDVDISNTDWTYSMTVVVHVLTAIAAGLATAVHSFGKSKLALALGGALGLLFSLAALFIGILLRSGR